MGTWVGIDLGTTNSAVAYVRPDGTPEIIPNREGEPLTPSIVVMTGDMPLVGAAAKQAVAVAPGDAALFVKRHMGDPGWAFQDGSGRRLRAEELSALILRRLKADAEEYLGEPVTDAVITVPAYFDETRRRATCDAGEIAGLRVRRVLNEPTAAALAYGLRADQSGTALVFDLGGGTFDVTVLRMDRGEITVLGTNGYRDLGGFNFDSELMRLLDQRFIAAGGETLIGSGAPEVLLREQAETLKRALGTVERGQAILSANGVSRAVEVSRAEFEDATASLLSKTCQLATIVLEDADLGWSGVDRLLLVGGSTRMPMVRRALEKLAGRRAERGVNPDQVVALGAAVQADLLSRDGPAGGELVPAVGRERITVQDVTSHGLGTLCLDDAGIRQVNAVIIARNTPIPAVDRQLFQTVRDRQPRVEVTVTQGDETDPTWVNVLDKFEVAVPPYPAGAPIEVRYGYDENQIIYVEVLDGTSGRSLIRHQVHNVNNMTRAQVTDAVRRVADIEVR
jgi:molecular chaperone DnaK